MTPTRILIVDDQLMFRRALHTLLSTQDCLEVIGSAADGVEALHLADIDPPDVVVVDLRMPGMSGTEAAKEFHKRHPQVKVLILTTFEDDDEIFEALLAGAHGYILKNADTNQLVEAINTVKAGQIYLQPSITTRVVNEFKRLLPSQNSCTSAIAALGLSARQVDILRRLGRGASNKEIAGDLNLTLGTVKNHITSILAALQVHDRTGAALKARELGLE